MKAGWHGSAGPPPSGGGENVNVTLQTPSEIIYVGDTITLTAQGGPTGGSYQNWTAVLNGLLDNDPANATRV